MKPYKKYTFLAAALASMVTLGGCFELPFPDAEESLAATMEESLKATVKAPNSDSQHCFDSSRETVRYFEAAVGELQVVQRNGQKVFVILAESAGGKFTHTLQPCSFPDGLKLHGNKILFSGEEKTRHKDEKLAGTPFYLTSIEEILETKQIKN